MSNHDGIENNKTYRSFRTSLDIGMGAIYIFIGAMVVYGNYFGALKLNATLAYFLGGLMIFYGIFRIFRGLKVILGNNRPE